MLTNKEDIEKFLRKKKINDYEIRKDPIYDNYIVDVKGDVNISGMGLDEIPFKFGKVEGDFNCNDNNIEELDGAPDEVGGSFSCDRNPIVDYSKVPRKVGGAFRHGKAEDNDGNVFEAGDSLRNIHGHYEEKAMNDYIKDHDKDNEEPIETEIDRIKRQTDFY